MAESLPFDGFLPGKGETPFSYLHYMRLVKCLCLKLVQKMAKKAVPKGRMKKPGGLGTARGPGEKLRGGGGWKAPPKARPSPGWPGAVRAVGKAGERGFGGGE
jgi:hypothetical protein